jgi:hypothetical protein
MVSASGSGARDALCESYQARSYLHFEISGQPFRFRGDSVTHLVIAKNLDFHQWIVISAEKRAYFIGLLQRGKSLGSAFYIILVLVWMVHQG